VKPSWDVVTLMSQEVLIFLYNVLAFSIIVHAKNWDVSFLPIAQALQEKFTWFHVCDLLVCELILALSEKISNNLVSSYIYAAMLVCYYILCKRLINKSHTWQDPSTLNTLWTGVSQD
jgi:hypothetical protein